MIENLKTYDENDRSLVAHCNRVGDLALALAAILNLKSDTRKQILIAGKLHDLGKRELNQVILNKPGKLTKEEFEHVKNHVFNGVNNAKKLGCSKFIIQSIYQHHESFDGTGYPEGLKGDEINIGGRILKVCDVFDALVSDRPYRKALNLAEAFKIMDLQRNEFDPKIYKTFKKMNIMRKDDCK